MSKMREDISECSRGEQNRLSRRMERDFGDLEEEIKKNCGERCGGCECSA